MLDSREKVWKADDDPKQPSYFQTRPPTVRVDPTAGAVKAAAELEVEAEELVEETETGTVEDAIAELVPLTKAWRGWYWWAITLEAKRAKVAIEETILMIGLDY